MNKKEFFLEQTTAPNHYFQLQKTQEARSFSIDQVKAYGLFAFGMLTMISGGFTAIGQFTPTGQILGWGGVVIGSLIAFKGAYKIGDL